MMLRHSAIVHILVATLINSPVIKAVPVTVSVTPLDAFMPQDYLDLFKAGVKHVVLAENLLSADGFIEFPGEWMTVPLAKEIHNYAVQHNATVSIGIVPQPFMSNSSRSLQDFVSNVQTTINNYYVDGLLFQLWLKSITPRGKEWEVVNNLTSITRSKLNSSRGNAATASIMFGSESLSSSLWEDLRVYQPWNYTDKYYSVLYSNSVDFKTQISIEWAGNITERLANMSANISDLSLTIIPEGHWSNLSDVKSYRDLIDDGAPASGDGYFDDFYYNSQKQIKEKAQLVKTRRLDGLTIFYPVLDLPATNASSLLHAAVSG
ncbi:hypothetical protein Pmar_PMAR001388 [Perkinsus marinus ATCC 50983]|uniref:Uncharacterized protein n=1 Tax=Perkinsus marinus (strain ATCC 50983 / TXsc) TaxID=423536 RepID=C5KJK4_PERM5|nr:hypothetical protein Pmar_PMAR001388 [Perkinsus marinus ATCC 50983]EER15338.1 hypothetical protein Pmar_PMAR001388 [Perkinsus marinus ATCC 50983]|eukprot:XP_002783542.1 hypothetical protein Pmar_PMAR001388 [Perkinsus marinus ATCC 50983]